MWSCTRRPIERCIRRALGPLFVGFVLTLARPATAHSGHDSEPPAEALSPQDHARNGNTNKTITGLTISRWKTAAAGQPTNPTVWMNLGNALMQHSRETPESAPCDQAREAYLRAIALAPEDPEAMVGLAWVSSTEHEFDQSRKWAQKAIAINPNLSEAHALLGDAAVELGDYDAAFDHCQRALDLAPNLASYSRAAHLLWLTGDVRKARWLMQKAIDAGGPYPENAAWCRAELARMLLQEGAVLPAAQQAEQALQSAADNPHVLAVLGQVQAARHQYAAAIESYQKALQLKQSHDVLVALGDLYALTGRQDEADKHYERVVAMHTARHRHGGAEAHVHVQGNAQLARFYADHDRNLEEALREAELAYRQSPNVFVADTLAWCYYQKGLYDQARLTIHKALRWNTPDANILFHAGMISARLHEPRQAKTYLYRALNLNPHFHPRYAAVAADTLRALSPPTARSQGVTVEEGGKDPQLPGGTPGP